MGKRLIFLLGGARSGKSTFAEAWAQEQGEQVLFVATAQAFDDEMHERIARHRADRPSTWQTLEAPLQVGRQIQALQTPADVILVDCVTLLASNALLMLPEDATQAQSDATILEEIDGLLQAYANSNATWLVVSNEVGMGIVPPSRLGRLFRDSLGRANQRIALHADAVWLLVAGIPWKLKGD